jgi:hypothetical protein
MIGGWLTLRYAFYIPPPPTTLVKFTATSRTASLELRPVQPGAAGSPSVALFLSGRRRKHLRNSPRRDEPRLSGCALCSPEWHILCAVKGLSVDLDFAPAPACRRQDSPHPATLLQREGHSRHHSRAENETGEAGGNRAPVFEGSNNG